MPGYRIRKNAKNEKAEKRAGTFCVPALFLIENIRSDGCAGRKCPIVYEKTVFSMEDRRDRIPLCVCVGAYAAVIFATSTVISSRVTLFLRAAARIASAYSRGPPGTSPASNSRSHADSSGEGETPSEIITI